VGWGIAGIYAAVFIWVLNVYLPGKFDDRLPANFREEWGKLQQNISNIQDWQKRLTPNSLNELIPSTNGSAKPATVSAGLERASRLIDVALRSQIPGDPALLAPLSSRVANIVRDYRAQPNVRLAAISTQIRLEGYAAASQKLLEGLRPTTMPIPEYEKAPPSSYFMGFTMNCLHPEAQFLAVYPPVSITSVVVFEVTVNTCAQKIGGPRWIGDQFNGSSIEYSGGPLYLADVTFVNCRFKFGDDRQSKQAMEAITASKGKPVTITIE
jgi:hypothetical protein